MPSGDAGHQISEATRWYSVIYQEIWRIRERTPGGSVSVMLTLADGQRLFLRRAWVTDAQHLELLLDRNIGPGAGSPRTITVDTSAIKAIAVFHSGPPWIGSAPR